MSYRSEEIFPRPEGYFPDFYELIFQEDQRLKQIYPNIGFHVNWDPILEARRNFPAANRLLLQKVIQDQYGRSGHQEVIQNIHAISDNKTFTVTTGQQIHIFLGPLYVVYKALSTIHLARSIQEKYPENRIVPVFWMATEDHDKAEINHVHLYGREFIWNTDQTGAVGRFTTTGLPELTEQIKELANGDPAFIEAMVVFENAYKQFENFADATRFLLDHFFGRYGLVVLDADHKELKSLFRDTMRKDLLGEGIADAMQTGIEALKQIGIDPSLPAKNGNFFLLHDRERVRLDRKGNQFVLQNKNQEISFSDVAEIIEKQPEKLSPNVALRPVYQETILPNLAYIAGPGEIRYWLQLTGIFQKCEVPLPALVPRHSLVITEPRFENWLPKSNLDIAQLWLNESGLKNALKDLLVKKDSLQDEILHLTELLNLINAKLYTQHNPGLKELKKAGEDYLKSIKKAEIDFTESIFSNQENQSRLEKALRFHLMYFDVTNPQERVVDFIQFHLGIPDFIRSISSLPKINLTNLYTYRYVQETKK